MAISELQLPQGVSAHAYKSPVLLAEGLALAVAKQLSDAIDTQGSATLVVSGGRSPVAFFQHLAKQKLEWSKVVVSLADERWVPVEHPDSNAGLLKRYLLQGPAASAQFLSLYSASANLEQAAEQADRLLAELPRIDVLILGMGDDGHTASLFPDAANLAEGLDPANPAALLAVVPPAAPHTRISMTLAEILRSGKLYLAIAGDNKRRVLEHASRTLSAVQPVSHLLQQTENPLHVYWAA